MKVLLSWPVAQAGVQNEQALKLLNTQHTHSNITFKWNFRPAAIEGSSRLIELELEFRIQRVKEFGRGLEAGPMMNTHTHTESGMRRLSQ